MYEDLCLRIGGGGRRKQVGVRGLTQRVGSTQTALRKRLVLHPPGLRGCVLHVTSGTGLVWSMLGKSLIPIEADNEGEDGDPYPAFPDSRSAGHPRYGLNSQRVAIRANTRFERNVFDEASFNGIGQRPNVSERPHDVGSTPSVESGCGAVAVGLACRLPSLSSDGAQVAVP